MSKLFESIKPNGAIALFFYCPGCKNYHSVVVAPDHNDNGSMWAWNGGTEKPTFSPSLLSSKGTDRQCHLFVHDGMIQFLDDCWHELRGQTIAMEDSEL